MAFSIVALWLNIIASFANCIAARRNCRRADALAAAERANLARARKNDTPPTTTESKSYHVEPEMLDPARIADPVLRHKVMMNRLLSEYYPN
jgi:high-affinity K+ transport system ATPase subunit B